MDQNKSDIKSDIEKEIEVLLDSDLDALMKRARKIQQEHFGNEVYVRGLIELTNYCKNDCYYCGIRAGNGNLERYRLTKEQVMDSCAHGHARGFRTFVIQGGEDPYFTKNRVAKMIQNIKSSYPDCAITLSLGEHDRDTYETWYEAGADRYLLRHETATAEHYSVLHPEDMLLENRLDCLRTLKDVGFQTGTGFMVGSPGQTMDHIKRDLEFIAEFQPHMVGIGPFIPHKDTKFNDMVHGDRDLVLRLIAILRILLPNAMLPSTTALSTIDSEGREKGILAGANVLMPNVSPPDAREKYDLYDNKSRKDEDLENKMEKIGYRIVESRGDYKCTTENQ